MMASKRCWGVWNGMGCMLDIDTMGEQTIEMMRDGLS